MGIPETAIRCLGDHVQAERRDRDAFFLCDVQQMVDNILLRYFFELEMLAPGNDRRRDFVKLGRRKNKDRMGGRLLQSLQESIECLPRQHVDLVDDDNLIAAVDGFVLHPFPERSHLVDPSVGSPVDFQNIDGTVFIDFVAEFAFVAGIGCRAMLTIQRFGKNPRRRGFPHSSHA